MKRNNTKTILTSSIFVIITIVVIKLLGFVKQAVIAKYYGASISTDTYYMAYGLVTAVNSIVFIALSMGIIPIYNDVKKKGDNSHVAFSSNLFIIIALITLFSLIVVYLSADYIPYIVAPSYSKDQRLLLSSNIKLLAPLLLLYGFEAVLSAVLNAEKRFFITKVESLFYSSIVVLGCAFFAKKFGINFLVFAQYLSYIIFIIILFVSSRKLIAFKKTNPFKDSHIRLLFINSVPIIVSYGVVYMNDIICKAFATSMDDGSVTALASSQTLTQFVTAIIVTVIGNISLSYFSDYNTNGKKEKIVESLSKIKTILVTVLIPISLITIIMSEDIIKLVYFRGSFTYDAVIKTAGALFGYGFGFVFVGIRDTNIKCLYALKKTRLAMINGIVYISANIILVLLLKDRFNLVGITIASSIASVIGMLLSSFFVKISLKTSFSKKDFFLYLKLAICAVIICMIILIIKDLVLIDNSFLKLFIVTLIILCIYFVLLVCLKVIVLKKGK